MQPLKGQGKLCELIGCSLHDVSLSEKDKFRMWIVWPMFCFKRHASCVCALWVTASMCVHSYFPLTDTQEIVTVIYKERVCRERWKRLSLYFSVLSVLSLLFDF